VSIFQAIFVAIFSKFDSQKKKKKFLARQMKKSPSSGRVRSSSKRKSSSASSQKPEKESTEQRGKKKHGRPKKKLESSSAHVVEEECADKVDDTLHVDHKNNQRHRAGGKSARKSKRTRSNSKKADEESSSSSNDDDDDNNDQDDDGNSASGDSSAEQDGDDGETLASKKVRKSPAAAHAAATAEKKKKPVEVVIRLRVKVLGDDGVGKKSLIFRIAENRFVENALDEASGRNFLTYVMRMENMSDVMSSQSGAQIRVEVDLFDLSAADRMRAVTMNAFRGYHGFIVAYDSTQLPTFKNLHKWLSLLKQSSVDPRRVGMAIVGTRVDRIEQRQVQMDHVRMLMEHYRFPHFACSSKDGKNVDAAMRRLVCDIFDLRSSEFQQRIGAQLAELRKSGALPPLDAGAASPSSKRSSKRHTFAGSPGSAASTSSGSGGKEKRSMRRRLKESAKMVIASTSGESGEHARAAAEARAKSKAAAKAAKVGSSLANGDSVANSTPPPAAATPSDSAEYAAYRERRAAILSVNYVAHLESKAARFALTVGGEGGGSNEANTLLQSAGPRGSLSPSSLSPTGSSSGGSGGDGSMGRSSDAAMLVRMLTQSSVVSSSASTSGIQETPSRPSSAPAPPLASSNQQNASMSKLSAFVRRRRSIPSSGDSASAVPSDLALSLDDDDLDDYDVKPDAAAADAAGKAGSYSVYNLSEDDEDDGGKAIPVGVADQIADDTEAEGAELVYGLASYDAEEEGAEAACAAAMAYMLVDDDDNEFVPPSASEKKAPSLTDSSGTMSSDSDSDDGKKSSKRSSSSKKRSRRRSSKKKRSKTTKSSREAPAPPSESSSSSSSSRLLSIQEMVRNYCDVNSRYQRISENLREFAREGVLDTALYRYRHIVNEMMDLKSDFINSTKTYGRIIIVERYIPLAKKTIRPLSTLGGQAGGEK
jgi:GTPase SAR1 family protein